MLGFRMPNFSASCQSRHQGLRLVWGYGLRGLRTVPPAGIQGICWRREFGGVFDSLPILTQIFQNPLVQV